MDKIQEMEREQFQAWKEHPVTQEVFRHLTNLRNSLKDQWAEGNFAAPSLDEMAIRNAAAQGAASAYQEILTLDEVALRGSDE